MDASAASSLLQEVTGASATTPSAVGDPVGSIRNLAAAGGWHTAFSNAARAVRQMVSGYAALQHDGVDDWYNLPAALTSTDWTMVEVITRVAGAGQPSYGRTADNDGFLNFPFSDNNTYAGPSPGVVAFYGLGATAGRQCMSNRRSGSSFEFRRAGAVAATRTTAGGAATITTLGRRNTVYFSGLRHESAIWTRALSDAEIAAVEAYMIAKWGAATS